MDIRKMPQPEDFSKLVNLLSPSEIQTLKATASPFGMSFSDRKKFELSVNMGYNEYGFASSLNSYYLEGRGISTNVFDNITASGIELYVDYLIHHTKQFIIDHHPDLIHKVI